MNLFEQGHAIRRDSYRELVQVAAQFLSLENKEEFLAFAASQLDFPNRDFLLAGLTRANRQADWAPVEILADNWIPCTYHQHSHEISWCLPMGRAVQPFYDEYISHCRQQIVNAVVVPRTSIDGLLLYAKKIPQLQEPAGFIFHLSRCGSTLVSGCLAQLENCSVLSESPLLTEILLAQNIGIADKKSLLRLCLYLQGRPSPHQPSVIVKWNAWDLFHWEMIRALWPQVPVLILVRSPVEILASHASRVGRHMSGDPSLRNVQDIFGRSAEFKRVLDYRIAVLGSLMTKMLQVHKTSEVFILDYAALDEAALMGICLHFGIEVSQSQRIALRQKMTRHSKSPGVEFQPDTEERRRRLSESEIADIKRALANLHQQLISKSNK